MPEDKGAKAANIFDVARLAGVSHQTVSRVLNHHPSIRPETKQRVLDVMMAFPLIIMALAVVSIFGTGVHNVIVAITLTP